MSDLKASFIESLRARHAGLAAQPREFLEEKTADGLLSPFTVTLPAHTLTAIRQTVKAFDVLREALIRAGTRNQDLAALGFADPGQRSIMMSYDFHADADGGLKLIEVNTNASFLILGHEMYGVRGIAAPAEFSAESLRRDVLEELARWSARSGRPVPEKPRIAIVDENPADQRLFLEFLVAREWFRGLGWDCEIRDVAAAAAEPVPHFVYNRSTDFLLQAPASAALRAFFTEGTACVSPNPHEYLLLADKQRLVDWTLPGGLDGLGLPDDARATLEGVLPKSYDLTAKSSDELWSMRKTLFFKPKREFGSKKAFKGASISRRLFDELIKDDPLAQEYVPAPEQIFETPAGPQGFKFDLRCHAYADRLEGVIARVYQGQVTNLKTPLGGFAPVVFR